MTAFVVTGTDTGIGKTLFAAGLVARLGGSYWKPVQAGLETETDSQTVARLSGRPVLPETWRLALPASPHLAAAAQGARIDPDRLTPPPVRPLVIEGAGGVMVPLTAGTLFLDLFARWRLPVILCARTSLGTINHTLLSLAALHARGVPVLGVAFIGDPAPEVETTITRIGGARRLGRLPILPRPDAPHLHAAFAEAFPAHAFTPETPA